MEGDWIMAESSQESRQPSAATKFVMYKGYLAGIEAAIESLQIKREEAVRMVFSAKAEMERDPALCPDR